MTKIWNSFFILPNPRDVRRFCCKENVSVCFHVFAKFETDFFRFQLLFQTFLIENFWNVMIFLAKFDKNVEFLLVQDTKNSFNFYIFWAKFTFEILLFPFFAKSSWNVQRFVASKKVFKLFLKTFFMPNSDFFGKNPTSLFPFANCLILMISDSEFMKRHDVFGQIWWKRFLFCFLAKFASTFDTNIDSRRRF